MNKLPRPKIHATPAAKAKAYRDRKRKENQAMIAAIDAYSSELRGEFGTKPSPWDKLTPEQKEALLRAYDRALSTQSLQKNAA